MIRDFLLLVVVFNPPGNMPFNRNHSWDKQTFHICNKTVICLETSVCRASAPMFSSSNSLVSGGIHACFSGDKTTHLPLKNKCSHRILVIFPHLPRMSAADGFGKGRLHFLQGMARRWLENLPTKMVI